jgi:hypothetical protein
VTTQAKPRETLERLPRDTLQQSLTGKVLLLDFRRDDGKGGRKLRLRSAGDVREMLPAKATSQDGCKHENAGEQSDAPSVSPGRSMGCKG